MKLILKVLKTLLIERKRHVSFNISCLVSATQNKLTTNKKYNTMKGGKHMFTSEKIVILADNINSRNAGNYTFHISNIESDIYFETEDRSINAKSILGLLSLSLKSMQSVNVKAVNKECVENAKRDLKKAIAFLEIEIGTM